MEPECTYVQHSGSASGVGGITNTRRQGQLVKQHHRIQNQVALEGRLSFPASLLVQPELSLPVPVVAGENDSGATSCAFKLAQLTRVCQWVRVSKNAMTSKAIVS